jgi:hypothetical protein
MTITEFFTGKKEERVETEFSKFIREAPSGTKKRVFMEVIKDATEDQRKIISKSLKRKSI